ncbi:AAA family ATPase [Sphingobacterium corticis]|uniref:AAA family ATPase n=1 Tax=Sphingobacterium corticis TaxID=1812823 RepID=A0ABW5NKX9_9SPHI
MRILKFVGTKIHDYINIDVEFNHDLSIVTGVNGSGKTTAILLLQAILCPNVKDLISIPFEKLALSIFYDGLEHHITLVTEGDNINININSIDVPMIINKRKLEEYDYIQYKQKDGIEVNDYLLKSIAPHPVIDFIQRLPSPIFIGLERRIDESQSDKDDFLMERRMFMNKSRHAISQYRRQYKGTLGVSLLETEFLVQSMYKTIKKIDDGYTAAIQKQILLSYFDYMTFDPKKDIANLDNYNEKLQLLSRRHEIEQTLRKIGYDNNAFVQKLQPFFEKLERLIDSIKPMETERSGISIEWLINRSQVDKLATLVEIIDDYNKKASKAFRPITKFVDIINSFIKDTGKKIYIDQVGHLFIKRPNGRDVSIDALSSGERQIVILFANVMFNRFSSQSQENILIIDEPELSLHIRWQDIFIEKLLIASEKTQFILATHSPDIVGDYKSKGVKINKNKKNAQ